MSAAATSGGRAGAARIVVVDDSAAMRAILSEVISADDLNVVGTAADAAEAVHQIRRLRAQAITLDVEMPGMDGLQFLKRLMAQAPLPVVMVSGMSARGADMTLDAIEAGAFDFIAKPTNAIERAAFPRRLQERLRAALVSRRPAGPASPSRAAKLASPAAPARGAKPRRKLRLVALGASTGGVTSIERILTTLQPGFPPVVIAQHMPREFTRRFSRRLANLTGFDVAEAEHGETLRPGKVRLAPGDGHLRVQTIGGRLVCRIDADDPPEPVRPSVDRLFRSVATSLGSAAAGVILSGMGRDGAAGLLDMRQAGAMTLGEGAGSCTVYGMPKAAHGLGATEREYDIADLARELGELTAADTAART